MGEKLSEGKKKGLSINPKTPKLFLFSLLRVIISIQYGMVSKPLSQLPDCQNRA